MGKTDYHDRIRSDRTSDLQVRHHSHHPQGIRSYAVRLSYNTHHPALHDRYLQAREAWTDSGSASGRRKDQRIKAGQCPANASAKHFSNNI